MSDGVVFMWTELHLGLIWTDKIDSMKIVYNKIIPFKDFTAMAFWPFVLVRNDAKLTCNVVNHEKIHGCQQAEILLLFFYVWYGVEWLVRFVVYKGDSKKAYEKMCFEREAYENQGDMLYLSKRNHFSWIKYL